MPRYEEEKLRLIAGEALGELMRATELHGPMRSGHEGYAVLKEEVDELWEMIKVNPKKLTEIQKAELKLKIREEAIQVAAMGMRFVLDVCGP